MIDRNGDALGEVEKMCFAKALEHRDMAQSADEIGLKKLRILCKGQEFAYRQMMKWVNSYRQERGTGWISVEDQLPKHDNDVLVTVSEKDGKGGYVCIDRYTCDGWFNCYDLYITAWMPMPKPYEVENEID